MSVAASEAGDVPEELYPEGDPSDERWRVGRRVRVEYEEEGEGGRKIKKWYPALITAYDEESETPYTIQFENGDTEQAQLPDNDMRSLPDGPCAICDKEDCYAEDLFVQCAACLLTVHQGCYGCRPFPGDTEWFCDLCAKDASRPALANVTTCALCGKRGGALKRTVDSRFHAHLACVIWIPEAHVVDTATMQPVEIRHVPISRQKLKCSLCKNKDAPMDAPVQCYEPSCARSFHVGCARESTENFYIAINAAGEAVAMCPRHVPEEFKRPKEAKNKGRAKLDKPVVKTISLREVLSDPILVGLEDKIKAVEEHKRVESQMLSEKMAHRMRESDMRRQRQRERQQAAHNRSAYDQAERANDVAAAQARAANASAHHALPNAAVWSGAAGDTGASTGAVQSAASAAAAGYPTHATAAHATAPTATPFLDMGENGYFNQEADEVSQDAHPAAGEAGAMAAAEPAAAAGMVGASAAHPGHAYAAHAYPPHAYPPHAHAHMMHGMHAGYGGPGQPGMVMPAAGYASNFSGMAGQATTGYAPPMPAPVFNEEEKKRDLERQGRAHEERRIETEARTREMHQEQNEARQIREHEHRIKDMREDERKLREEYVETKRKMREQKRQIERDAKQAKRDAQQSKKDEAEALRLAKEEKKRMREMRLSGRLTAVDRDVGARQSMHADTSLNAPAVLEGASVCERIERKREREKE